VGQQQIATEEAVLADQNLSQAKKGQITEARFFGGSSKPRRPPAATR